ncbi:MAG: sulfotransferase [Planctomycetota bacterium]
MNERQFVAAIPHLEQLAAQCPAHFLPRAWLGQAYVACDRLEEADRAFGAALGKAPEMPQLFVERGRVASLRGEQQNARALWERALEIGLPDAASHFAVCHLLYQGGARERAIAEYRAALRRFPDHPRGWTNLALKAPGELTAAEWKQIRRLAAAPNLAPREAAGLHYALAADARRRGDVGAVQEHAAVANRLHGSTLVDTAKVHRRYRAGVIETYDPAHFDRVAAAPPAKDQAPAEGAPIFVLGLPRSGTTLVEQILATHSTVFGGGELRVIPASLEELSLDVGMTPEGAVKGLSLEEIATRSQQVARRYREMAGKHRCVTDKMPENYLHLGWIATLLPHARVIHLQRDPRDVALSLWLTRLIELDWTCDLQRIAEHIEGHAAVMQHWREVLPTRIHEVCYEQLTTKPEPEIRRLLSYCGLSFEEQCLRSHETSRAVDTASIDQVTQPIHAGAIGQWREYRDMLAPILQRLECVAGT